MTSEQATNTVSDDFDAAWRAATDQARSGLDLWAALGRLTG